MSYTKNQVEESSGLDARLVQYYTERQILTPGVDLGEGRGKVRKYSRKNVVEAGIIKYLADYGMTVSRVREIMAKVKGYILFKRLFSSKGELVKSVDSGQRVLLTVYDMREVELKQMGSAIKKIEVSISGHRSALIIDITEGLKV